MKENKVTLGIDVSKKKLDVTLVTNPKDKEHLHFIIPNTKTGIRSIFKRLEKLNIQKEDILICFEHTGVYAMLLCYEFEKMKIEYYIVSSLEIHRSRGIFRGKTDKKDSEMIAFYAITHKHKLKSVMLPEETLMKIKILLSERGKLVKAIGMFQKAKEMKGFFPKIVIEQATAINKETITFLKKQLRMIDSSIKKLIESDSELKAKHDLITTVPGVGVHTANYLITITRNFTAFDNWRKLACYGGIAPFEYSSGSSIRGKTQVSQLANKKLKSILNMAALSARVYDPQLKAYYERKVGEGKHPLSVMNAIKCKVISRVFATVKRGTPFVKIEAF